MTPEMLKQKILEIRGYNTPALQEKFLNPDYQDSYDPFLMHDMEKSVDRICQAIASQEKICIYSDYDADGIPGAVILHDFFKKIGYENFFNYIPHRHHEGYGLHKDALQKIADQGTKLVITVDLGITAVDEVVFARGLGMEVIITDHHEPLEIIPDAYAIVNPKLGNYPDRMLCGAGVAFKLVQALINFARPENSSDAAEACLSEASSAKLALTSSESQESLEDISSLRPSQTHPLRQKYIPRIPVVGWEKWLLDMAGLATLSDMVPLVNENRIIAYYGMKVLQKTPRPGLRALFQKSGINLNYLTEDDIVFSITPRLNAAGRMAHPEDAFNTLSAVDPKQGLIGAEHLSTLNDERKKIVAQIMKQVHKKMQIRIQEKNMPSVIVMGDPTYPAGILGLVASKITEIYNKTSFVWGAEGDSIKGSCRSAGDVSVVALMEKTSHLLVQFGGHAEAGGFSATRETIHFLEQACCDVFESVKKNVADQKIVSYDCELGLEHLTLDHYRALRTLAPFGVGNPKPVFLFRSVLVVAIKQFGKTREHLELLLENNKRAIKWYATPNDFSVIAIAGERVNLLATFDFSVFRGTSELRLMIVDVVG
jgi:single-stranded-DNA-specific exonuclease